MALQDVVVYKPSLRRGHKSIFWSSLNLQRHWFSWLHFCSMQQDIVYNKKHMDNCSNVLQAIAHLLFKIYLMSLCLKLEVINLTFKMITNVTFNFIQAVATHPNRSTVIWLLRVENHSCWFLKLISIKYSELLKSYCVKLEVINFTCEVTATWGSDYA